VVGETSGMRGREPPVIHRVETFHYFVARGIRFSFQNREVAGLYSIGTFEAASGCMEPMSMFDASEIGDLADEETRS
jgi:hypothetical protein